jgi:hypothetical protein
VRDGTSARAGSRPPNLGLIYVDAGAESDGASQTCACGTERGVTEDEREREEDESRKSRWLVHLACCWIELGGA